MTTSVNTAKFERIVKDYVRDADISELSFHRVRKNSCTVTYVVDGLYGTVIERGMVIFNNEIVKTYTIY